MFDTQLFDSCVTSLVWVYAKTTDYIQRKNNLIAAYKIQVWFRYRLVPRCLNIDTIWPNSVDSANSIECKTKFDVCDVVALADMETYDTAVQLMAKCPGPFTAKPESNDDMMLWRDGRLHPPTGRPTGRREDRAEDGMADELVDAVDHLVLRCGLWIKNIHGHGVEVKATK